MEGGGKKGGVRRSREGVERRAEWIWAVMEKCRRSW